MELANCKIKILTVSRGEGKSGQEVKILLGKECTEHEQEPITWHESLINPTIIQTWVLDREELEKITKTENPVVYTRVLIMKKTLVLINLSNFIIPP